MKKNLRNKFILAITSSIVLIVTLTALVLNYLISNEMYVKLEEDMKETLMIYKEFQENRRAMMRAEGRVVAFNPTINAAVSTKDPATVYETARVIPSLVSSDLFIISDERGKILTQIPSIGEVDLSFLDTVLNEAKEFSGFLAQKGKLCQIVSLPLATSFGPLGSITLGFVVDDKLTQIIKSVTQSEVSFFLEEELIASTFTKNSDRNQLKEGYKGYWQSLRKRKIREGLYAGNIRIGNVTYYSHFLPIQGVVGNSIGTYVIQRSLDKATEFKATILRFIISIGIIVVVLMAISINYLVVRGLTNPIKNLVEVTHQVTKGDLEVQAQIPSQDEMGLLANSFNRMTQTLYRRKLELDRLNEAVKSLNFILELDTLLEIGVQTAKDILQVSKVLLMLKEGDFLFIRAHKGWEGFPLLSNPFSLNKGVVGMVAKGLNSISLSDGELPLAESIDENIKFAENYKHLLCVPLVHENQFKGIMALQDRIDGVPFDKSGIEFAEIIAASITISLLNIELLEKTVEKTRMEEELRTAELVQKTLFPREDLILEGLEIAGFFNSALETGGDWYGYLQDGKGEKVSVLIGDVTGKGVSAALVTASVFSFFRTLKATEGVCPYHICNSLSPGNILKLLNKIIMDATQGHLVMTLFAATYNLKTKELVFSNAGHDFPLLYKGNKLEKSKPVEVLFSNGSRLGEKEDVEFEEKQIQLFPGDVILCYTDGLTEGTNKKGEEYGEKRLQRSLGKYLHLPAKEIREMIVRDAYEFFDSTPQKDDVAFVVIKVPEKTSRRGNLRWVTQENVHLVNTFLNALSI